MTVRSVSEKKRDRDIQLLKKQLKEIRQAQSKRKQAEEELNES